jgi:uncharacterized membrane protein YgdD (TMEM256/DUF423 family)
MSKINKKTSHIYFVLSEGMTKRKTEESANLLIINTKCEKKIKIKKIKKKLFLIALHFFSGALYILLNIN